MIFRTAADKMILRILDPIFVGSSMVKEKFDGAIEIRVIPHKNQRYDTVGDWWHDQYGWHIRISQLGDWRFQFLVAFHELLEMAWCAQNDVSEKSVTVFDLEYEQDRKPGDESEPGDDPKAPYRAGHQFASAAERLAAAVLGVDWAQYERAIHALDYKK